MKKELITANVVMVVNQTHDELNCLPRWSNVYNGNRYDELSKQALNGIVFLLLAKEAEKAGIKLDLTKAPLISMYRSQYKSMLGDIIDDKIHKCCVYMGLTKGQFKDLTIKQKANFFKENVELYGEKAEEISTEFLAFTQELKKAEENSTRETQFFRAATKIATLIEAIELGNQKSVFEILCSMEEFKDFPGFQRIASITETYTEIQGHDTFVGFTLNESKSPEFNLISEISRLGNKTRWAKKAKTASCSVLGHMYDVAVFAYMISILNGESEKTATRAFFSGLLHDVPEIWTGDIQSPLKDGISNIKDSKLITLREASEELERETMEVNVYSKLPNHLSCAIREHFIEDKGNLEIKDTLKVADHMSAISEIHRLISGGSREPELALIVDRYFENDQYKMPDNFKRLAWAIKKQAEPLKNYSLFTC